MRLGVVSPIVTANPGAHADWEATAGIAELGQVAEAADRLGLHHLTCSEHVAVPAADVQARGGTYWDPLATFGYLAARTSQIRLLTQVLVIGYHHPLAIAKRYGTLDRVSGGRLMLGIGVGSLETEFDLLGARFGGRGAIADDALAALRASLSTREPEYHGSHYDYAGMVIDPHAVQPRVPLLIGGHTPRSLRRAVTLGDGWVPFGLAPDRIRQLLSTRELPADFEVILSPGSMLDPGGDPAGTTRRLSRLRDAGATIATASVTGTSLAHYLEQLEALAVLAGDLD